LKREVEHLELLIFGGKQPKTLSGIETSPFKYPDPFWLIQRKTT